VTKAIIEKVFDGREKEDDCGSFPIY